MLDWDSLLPAELGQSDTPETGPSVPPCPSENAPLSQSVGQPKANNGAAFGSSVPVVPVVPVKNQGKAEVDTTAGGGGGEENLRVRDEDSGPEVDRCDPCRFFRPWENRITDTCRGGGLPYLDTYRGRYRVRPLGGRCGRFAKRDGATT